MEWVGGVCSPAVGGTASLQARLPQSLSCPCPLGASSPEHGLGTWEPTSQPAPSPLAHSNPKIQASNFNNLGPSWL